LGVYVSVPFCRAKCSFCNFASGVGTGAGLERYVERLCAEIDAAAEAAQRFGAELPRVVDTVYFGGGTPSLLAPVQLRRIVAALRRSFEVTPDAEMTLEAAPGQIAGETLEEALRLGVNRVSLGVQSFVDRECAAVGRLHTGRDCAAEIERLQAAGVAHVGADLIAGLPLQTPASWTRSLDIAAELGAAGALTHLSVYMLEVDEDSRLGREVLVGGPRFHAPDVPGDDLSAELYETACERLALTGFAQYEISNFARAGHRSRHNAKYWLRQPYFGFGLDAHSMLRLPDGRSAVRLANPDGLADYDAGAPAEVTRVGQREAFEETVFLGLRMWEGVAVAGLREGFVWEWVREFEAAAWELIEEGLMVAEDGCWRLTQRGRLVSNEVFGRVLEGVVA
jgi:oxygen-independent coproporphyrinogen-3 oxidase